MLLSIWPWRKFDAPMYTQTILSKILFSSVGPAPLLKLMKVLKTLLLVIRRKLVGVQEVTEDVFVFSWLYLMIKSIQRSYMDRDIPWLLQAIFWTLYKIMSLVSLSTWGSTISFFEPLLRANTNRNCIGIRSKEMR